MKRHLSIRPEAKTDITRAFNWYRDRSEELGRMFVDELQRILEAIEERPMSYPRIMARNDELSSVDFHTPCSIDYLQMRSSCWECSTRPVIHGGGKC